MQSGGHLITKIKITAYPGVSDILSHTFIQITARSMLNMLSYSIFIKDI